MMNGSENGNYFDYLTNGFPDISNELFGLSNDWSFSRSPSPEEDKRPDSPSDLQTLAYVVVNDGNCSSFRPLSRVYPTPMPKSMVVDLLNPSPHNVVGLWAPSGSGVALQAAPPQVVQTVQLNRLFRTPAPRGNLELADQRGPLRRPSLPHSRVNGTGPVFRPPNSDLCYIIDPESRNYSHIELRVLTLSVHVPGRDLLPRDYIAFDEDVRSRIYHKALRGEVVLREPVLKAGLRTGAIHITFRSQDDLHAFKDFVEAIRPRGMGYGVKYTTDKFAAPFDDFTKIKPRQVNRRPSKPSDDLESTSRNTGKITKRI